MLLVGQSYGAAIATLMASMRPQTLGGLVLLSSFLGQFGPTSNWLVNTGRNVLSLIPRDLRHAIIEVTGQAQQLHHMQDALARVACPVHVLHGDKDDFAPIELAQKLVAETKSRRPIRFEAVPGADHFINDGPEEAVIAALEACLPPTRKPKARFRLPRLEGLKLPNFDLAAALRPPQAQGT